MLISVFRIRFHLNADPGIVIQANTSMDLTFKNADTDPGKTGTNFGQRPIKQSGTGIC
jgi:hypothetical protein